MSSSSFPSWLLGGPLDFPSKTRKPPKTDMINMFKSISTLNNGPIYSPSGFSSKINDINMNSKLPSSLTLVPSAPLRYWVTRLCQLFAASILVSPFPHHTIWQNQCLLHSFPTTTSLSDMLLSHFFDFVVRVISYQENHIGLVFCLKQFPDTKM